MHLRKLAQRRSMWVIVGLATIVVCLGLFPYGAAIYSYLSGLTPSAEQGASDAYAEKIQVRGYKLIDRRKEARNDPKDYLYLGPTHSNVLEPISGPHLELGPPRSYQVPSGFVEPVGYGDVTEPVNGMACGVYVDRVKRGIDVPDLYGLTPTEEAGVRLGELTILEITVLCHED